MKHLSALGSGMAFPIVPGQAGSLAMAAGPEKVRQSILLIIGTEPGERVMRPHFGVGLRRFLMKPNSVATRASIRQEVERGLSNAEPRIRIEEVRVDPGDDPSLVVIQIAYRLVRDGSPDSLVYPFYLNE